MSDCLEMLVFLTGGIGIVMLLLGALNGLSLPFIAGGVLLLAIGCPTLSFCVKLLSR